MAMLTGNSKSWMIGSLVTVVSLLLVACAPAGHDQGIGEPEDCPRVLKEQPHFCL